MELNEAFFDTGEIRLHYMEGPQTGPPLVLLHGSTGNWTSWNQTMPAFAEKWQVFALDLRGHGQSGRAADMEGYHGSYFVRDILAFLRERVKTPAVLTGHSWGAVVSLLCGMPGKDFLRGLVLEDPPIYIRRPNQEMQPYLDYFGWVYQLKQSTHTLEELSAALQEANGGTLPPERLDPWAQSLYNVDANYLLSLALPQWPVKGIDFTEAIRGIACPILLLQADLAKGAALQPEDLDLVLQNAKDARVVRFPGSGHGIHEEQTAKYLETLKAFFTTL